MLSESTVWPGSDSGQDQMSWWNTPKKKQSHEKQSIWTGNAKLRGESSPFIETTARPQHLTETKCEEICTRKREISLTYFNPPPVCYSQISL